MDFKDRVIELSKDEFNNTYINLKSRARDRKTDLNDKSIKYILENIDSRSVKIIDVGCGNGYLLESINGNFEKYGCDLYDNHNNLSFRYIKGDLECLPFDDNSFDTVLCCHTIEHLPNIYKAVSELIRISARQLIIVVPKQRYYYYTLDLHLHFFFDKFSIINLIGLSHYSIEEKAGDWVYIGYFD